jgi:hypothetical protein
MRLCNVLQPFSLVSMQGTIIVETTYIKQRSGATVSNHQLRVIPEPTRRLLFPSS